MRLFVYKNAQMSRRPQLDQTLHKKHVPKLAIQLRHTIE